MAKLILKNTPQLAVVKLTNATETIALTDLELSQQTLVSGAELTIRKICVIIPSGGSGVITRNSIVLYTFPVGTDSLDFTADGFVDDQEADESIVVNATGGSTIILNLSKRSGWGDEQHLNSTEPSEVV